MGGELTVRSAPGAGSTFVVRLFLPEVTAAASASPAAARQGYEGPRRRLLVVDNEEADRSLMVDQLQPLGFAVETVASGEAALARLADPALPQPDAVFMDLAMPGIDGWETIRRLRGTPAGALPLAVVSANAFDRGLDHDVGLAAADFLVKPVRLATLLDWLGERLQIRWTAGVAPWSGTQADTPPGVLPETLPDAEQLRALQALVGQGYVRGIHRKLDEIAAADVAAQRFVARLRALAQRFELDALGVAIGQALDERQRR
jgi:CheY-like chemotaxis protein